MQISKQIKENNLYINGQRLSQPLAENIETVSQCKDCKTHIK